MKNEARSCIIILLKRQLQIHPKALAAFMLLIRNQLLTIPVGSSYVPSPDPWGDSNMKTVSLLCLSIMLLTFCTGLALAFENSSVVGQVPDRIVVTLKPGVAFSTDKAAGMTKAQVPALAGLIAKFKVRNMEQLYAGLTTNLADKSAKDIFDRTIAIDFPAEMGLQTVKAAFAASGLVENVRLVDICRNYAYLPDDPGLTGNQYYVRNMTLGGADVRALGAWNQSLGDSNVIVAIVDSGVDWHHLDLGGTGPDQVNGAIWTNWAEYYGTPGFDDDSNGKVDDIRGWDFVNVPGQGYPDEDDTTPDNDPMDYESHGTACAGTVAGIGNNGIGIAGVAHGCKIMPVRVGWLPDGETGGVVRMDFASQGILYAANNGAKVINCSWGSTSYLSMAVSAAVDAGVVIVTAAGNDDTDSDVGLGVPSYLSTHPDVLSVAATQQNDAKASFSNYGSWVELAAPGVDIYSTWYNVATDTHTYASINGTSFSSPITCGAIALLWSHNPSYSRTGVMTALLNSCDNIDAINPTYAGLLGHGRINLLRAMGDNFQSFPAEFPTVFDAINEASVGDTIAFTASSSPAVPLTILGRDLKILGGYSNDYLTRDPVNNPTVLNGNLANTVLRFQGAVDANTIIDGFLIQGGGGQNFSGIPYTAQYGGGAIVKDVSPTLRNLEITGNSVGSSSQLGCGGGLVLINSSSTLENVHVHDNTGIYGGGVFIYNSTIAMTDCVIENNTVVTDNLTSVPLGGGLHVLDSTLTLNSCDITGHTDTENGGGIYLDGFNGVSDLTWNGGLVGNNGAKTNGGGLYMAGGSASLSQVTFTGNGLLPASTFMYGGGAFFNGTSVQADSLICTGNTASIGGGFHMQDCPLADLTHSVVTGNSAAYFGGGLNYQNNTAGTVAMNTIADNAGTGMGGGGIYLTGTSPTMDHNIVAANTGGTNFANGIAATATPAVFSCNDVFGNSGADYSGFTDPTGTDGNIAVDPAFCDAPGGDYRIGTSSPCAAANNPGCGLIGALDVCAASPVPGDQDTPVAFHVDNNFPNPFNPRTTIRFNLAQSARTQVMIFDVAGRKVKTLVNAVLPASTQTVTWNGDDESGRLVAAGVYFYMVISGDNTSVGRMALVK